jgi:hypothetical protein
VLLPGQLELTPTLPPQLALPCRPQICVHLADDSGFEARLRAAQSQISNRQIARLENGFNFHETKGGREF